MTRNSYLAFLVLITSLSILGFTLVDAGSKKQTSQTHASAPVGLSGARAEAAPLTVLESVGERTELPMTSPVKEASTAISPPVTVPTPAVRDVDILLLGASDCGWLDSMDASMETTVEGEARQWSAPINGARVSFEEIPVGTPVAFVLTRRGESQFRIAKELIVEPGAVHTRGTVEIDLPRWFTSATSPISTLRSIAAAQQQLQASAAIDTDGDGGGEFGYFAEMAGRLPTRTYDGSGGPARGTDEHRLDPYYLPASFGVLEAAGAAGVVTRAGYHYRMHLPGAGLYDGVNVMGCAPLAEAPGGGAGATFPDPTAAELLWCCYAWPIESGFPGDRVYFIGQGGDVMTAIDASCFGRHGGPEADAIFSEPRDMASHPGLAPAGLDSQDGRVWFPASN